MKPASLFLITIISFCLGCNEASTSAESYETETATTTDSTYNMESQGEQAPPQQDNVIRDELEPYNLPTDGISVNFRSGKDSLFGYRNGDTLIVEGDMLFIKEKEKNRGIGTTWRIWNISNNKILVPYVINPSYADSARVHQAMQMWSRNNFPITFVRKTHSMTDYIEFVPSTYTRSFVGRIRGRQPIELANWARSGNIAHEIGHALGLYHEHTRSDRDDFVRVSPDCANNVNFRHAFKRDPYARNIGNYDFFSIMHYGPSNCMSVIRNGLPSGVPGQRDSITWGDYTSIRSIYQLQP